MLPYLSLIAKKNNVKNVKVRTQKVNVSGQIILIEYQVLTK